MRSTRPGNQRTVPITGDRQERIFLSQKVWDHDWTDLPASFRRSAEMEGACGLHGMSGAEHVTSNAIIQGEMPVLTMLSVFCIRNRKCLSD